MVVTEIETNLDNSILTENWNDPLLQHCVFEPFEQFGFGS